MTRNWNKVRARLTDPFDPDNEEVDQQIEAMIAKQDAQGGHVYPEFHLPDSHPSKSSRPAKDDSQLSERSIPTRAKSTEATSSTREDANAIEVPPSKARKCANLQDNLDSLASRLDRAVTASKRAVFRKRKEGARQPDIPSSYTDTNTSKLDQPLRRPKRKADDTTHDEERGRQAKRRTAPDGRPTSPPLEDYLDY
ncbi:hypothetical protein FJTKL_01311 [Diaporthe vaccinii]|uniref:Uncharacterized protein n=1 Tax=Diaporthe vaccinii TaxID=105482 RepID=A0ABR4E137_9PEZI